MKKRIAIFGSTGSIGGSTLNVIRRNPERFEVSALVAGQNVEKLSEQIREFSPRHVYIASPAHRELLLRRFPGLDVYCGGTQGLEEIAALEDFDLGVSALVGIAGLSPTLKMIQNGKDVALANKEVLVTGGALVTGAAAQSGARLLTVDSEHSAVMQCLRGENPRRLSRIFLTASGGPFLDREITDAVTPEQALAHPTWKMGAKVSIDSATMMNKGFEIIEAMWLFGAALQQIEVVIHRQSLVHSMAEFSDGTIMASIAPASMELPIAYALAYPDRLPAPRRLDLFEIGALRFERPDPKKFPCLRLARQAAESGPCAQIALNAADEVLVQAFLEGKIRFTDIPRGVETALAFDFGPSPRSAEEILALDRAVRRRLAEALRL